MISVRAIYSLFSVLFLLLVFAATSYGQEVVSKDGHLVLYDSGVVHDAKSGLQWYAGPDKAVSWEEAKKWAALLDASGGGWRMPDYDELCTLYRIGDGVSNITHLLHNTGFWIWAGETKKTYSRWIFSFSYGGEGWNGRAPEDGGRAIAVRSQKRIH